MATRPSPMVDRKGWTGLGEQDVGKKIYDINAEAYIFRAFEPVKLGRRQDELVSL